MDFRKWDKYDDNDDIDKIDEDIKVFHSNSMKLAR